jgi:hypothetical protein
LFPLAPNIVRTGCGKIIHLIGGDAPKTAPKSESSAAPSKAATIQASAPPQPSAKSIAKAPKAPYANAAPAKAADPMAVLEDRVLALESALKDRNTKLAKLEKRILEIKGKA